MVIGLTSTANVSGYTRTRVHDVRLLLGEKRVLTANFNGAMDSGRTITSGTWRCDFGDVAQMSNAAIASDRRSTSVDVSAGWLGENMIRCEATLDDGGKLIQSFHIEVSGDPYFLTGPSPSGPTELTTP